ncbi:MAG: nucleoside-diphosphate sugar epimerase/dehydratase [Bacteroidaceae bacterium]
MIRTFIHRYLSAKVLPIWTVFLFDVLLVVISCLISYFLRFDLNSLEERSAAIELALAITIALNMFSFRCFRTYLGVLRYSSFVDIMRIFVSITLSYSLLLIGNLIYHLILGNKFMPDSVIFMAYVLNFALMSSSRIVVKLFYESATFDGSKSMNVFIYGAKESGINIAKSLRVSKNNYYRLRGFIADESELIKKVMMGVKVYPNDNTLLDNIEDRRVNAVIVSPMKMNGLRNSPLLDELLSHHIKLLSAPPLSEWNNQTLEHTQLKNIEIEDLLPRTPIQVDLAKIASHLENKRVMITGAAGSIGGEIMRQVVKFNPYQLILVDQAETPLHDIRLELQDYWRNINAVTIIADVSNSTRMEKIFEEYRPQYIFHAAAYKHVPMMEDNVSESIQTNVLGTKIMADLAVKYTAEKFVMISTDKAVNPTNVMGCSKRLAEIYVQSLAKKLKSEGDNSVKFITTRFGNVLGSNGSVIPRFREQIERGGPVTVTHPDIIRYFMTIPEACRLVLEAGSMGNGGEIYIFDMGTPVKIVDLAKRMIYLSGRSNIKIEFTGLRHGEKLYEELLNAKEHTKPTYHEKIMIANVREYDYEEVKVHLDKLISESYTYNQMHIVAAMKEIVPEFISKNSCFETLDKK